MSILKRNIVYFKRPGSLNSLSVIEAVKERLKFKDVKQVLVPFTTGKTADLFSRELGNITEIITISEDEAVTASNKIASSDKGLLGKLIRNRLEGASEEALERLHREAIDLAFLPFSGESWNVVKEVLFVFGQGMKVALEIALVAVEIKKVKPYIEVIAVGGTGEGVDTAIVIKTASQDEAFGEVPKRRISIREILAIPLEKW